MLNSKWLIGALVASLTLNLLGAGFLLGRVSSGELMSAPLDPAFGFMRVVRQWPDARREALMPVMREHFRDLRPMLRGIQRGHRAFFDALSEEPLNKALVEQRLAELRTRLDASQAANHEALIAFAGELTPEERAQWRDWMQRRPDRPRRGPGRHFGPPDHP